MRLKPGNLDEPTVKQEPEGPDAPEWLAAIHADIEQLKDRKDWRLISRDDVPDGRKVLGLLRQS